MDILYINGQAYAGGVANNSRVTAMAQAMRTLGHDVTLLSGPTLKESFDPKTSRFHLPKALSLGAETSQWFSGRSKSPDIVILYGTDIRYILRAIKWCRKLNVPLLVEIVDWYKPSDVRGIVSKIFSILNGTFSMWLTNRFSSGTIVASKLLESKFQRTDTLYLPAIIDENLLEDFASYQSIDSDLGILKICYAGSADARDQATLHNLKKFVEESPDLGLRIQINILGGKDRGIMRGNKIELIQHGRVPRAQALRTIASSDFSVLQRDAGAHFAQAGFPSKIAESLMLGTPVICNLTSDLSNFLVEGENAVIVKDDSYLSLLLGMEKAVEYKQHTKIESALVARSAKKHFSVEELSRSLNGFFSKFVT